MGISKQENRGFLDFKDYLLASSVKIETTQDKLDWIFRAFDADNDGRITETEIRKIVIYLFKVANIDEGEEFLVACIADIKLVHHHSSHISELTKNYFLGWLSALTAISPSPGRNLSRMESRANF